MFDKCKLTAAPEATKVYLGRPWRPYAHTMFINCEMGSHIRPEGWHNWNDPNNESTARYGEYGSTGEGASQAARVDWATSLTPEHAKALLDLSNTFAKAGTWIPENK